MNELPYFARPQVFIKLQRLDVYAGTVALTGPSWIDTARIKSVSDIEFPQTTQYRSADFMRMPAIVTACNRRLCGESVLCWPGGHHRRGYRRGVASRPRSPRQPLGAAMKALTVQQPWAGLIFAGKDVENRTWHTHYRGPLLIHAALQRARHALIPIAAVTDPLWAGYCEPRGAIIGQVTLARIVRTRKNSWADRGAWHWCLSDPVLFDQPIAAKGRLGLWEYAL